MSSLVTVAECKALIPELTGTAMDTVIESLAAQVSTLIARHCGYPAASAGAAPTMDSASYVRYYDGPGGRDLDLEVYPVTAVASVYDDADRTWGASTLIDSANYTLIDGRRLLLASGYSFSTAKGAIKVSFTAGDATPDDGLKRIAIMAVREAWAARGTPRDDNAPALVGLSAAVRAELNRGGYVLPRVYVPSGA